MVRDNRQVLCTSPAYIERHGKLTVRMRAVNLSNDGDTVRRWALLGRCITYKSQLDAANHLAQGHLRARCNDWATEPTAVPRVLNKRQLRPFLRELFDFVANKAKELAQLPRTSIA